MKTLNLILVCFMFLGTLACNGTNKKPSITSHIDSKEIDLDDDEKTIQVALLLDTSNSMDGLIDQAKAQLWKIVNELSYAKCKDDHPKLEIALYEYGNDGLSNASGFVRQILPFTNDLDNVSAKLFGLTTNGGSEYCGKVINDAVTGLPWKTGKNDLKLIFIAGNEPFTQGPVNYKDAATNAKEKDVTINTIFCGNYNHGISGFWQDGALITQGDYMAIDHNVKTVHIPSPYDNEILQLNIQLNETYIYYGREGKNKAMAQAQEDSNALSYGEANGVARAVTKSSKMYYNASWDLVDAEANDEIEIESINKELLPKELKGKSIKEIKAVIEKKREQREAINKKIQELNKKRESFVKKAKKDNAETTLEEAMVNAIKKQAKRKDYEWKDN